MTLEKSTLTRCMWRGKKRMIWEKKMDYNPLLTRCRSKLDFDLLSGSKFKWNWVPTSRSYYILYGSVQRWHSMIIIEKKRMSNYCQNQNLIRKCCMCFNFFTQSLIVSWSKKKFNTKYCHNNVIGFLGKVMTGTTPLTWKILWLTLR